MPPLPTPYQSMIRQMTRLIETFSARVEDRSTLDELHRMIGDEKSWNKAHDLFSQIRRKSLVTDRGDFRTLTQYGFEEACAKTLFNLTNTKIQFDNHAPYWVVPQALRLAKRLGMNEGEITAIMVS